jgi:NAD(P)-dependent dehydrogenase (short-subunit alcohol dehydrogenase family)
MTQLGGRTCLITGASSGLGAHFARTLSGAGARVVLAARRLDRVQTLASEIRATGGQAFPLAMNVSDEKSVVSAFDAAEQAFGIVDTIIANAGVAAPGRSTEVPIEALRNVLDTNILGVMITAREGARRLIASGSRDHGRGRIVIIGSITAEMTGQGDAMYSASKAAVAHMGRTLAREWVRQGVNVNIIQPGYIDTELAGEWFGSEGGKAQIAAFHRKQLQPIASLDGPLLYLCSDQSAHTTGAVLTIDDGQSL